jgi:hypothetical protein
VVIVGLLVVTSGCVGPLTNSEPEKFSIQVRGHTVQEETNYTFEGWVSIGGKYDDPSFHDVSVQFIGRNGQVIKSVEISEVNSSRNPVNISVSVPEQVHAVVLRIGRVDSSDGYACGISGLQRENGRLVPTMQRDITNSSRTPAESCFTAGVEQ